MHTWTNDFLNEIVVLYFTWHMHTQKIFVIVVRCYKVILFLYLYCQLLLLLLLTLSLESYRLCYFYSLCISYSIQSFKHWASCVCECVFTKSFSTHSILKCVYTFIMAMSLRVFRFAVCARVCFDTVSLAWNKYKTWCLLCITHAYIWQLDCRHRVSYLSLNFTFMLEKFYFFFSFC